MSGDRFVSTCLKPSVIQSVFRAMIMMTALQRPLSEAPHWQTEVWDANFHWHPKVTVYRLLFISTTIFLGSAKAAAEYNEKSYVSTTIEWIAGIAVFILLSSLRSHMLYLIVYLTNSL
jgi:hypothetical protein